MKRTNSLTAFVTANRPLLVLWVLLLAGCVLGIVLYGSSKDALPELLSSWVKPTMVTDNFQDMLQQIAASCFQALALLLVLFIGGLSACGMPVACAVPLFWGMGLGMTLGYYYALGGHGVLFSALLVLPHSLIEGVAILLGSAQSLQLSWQLSRQLLPHSAHCGGLWQPFRAYCIRFCAFFLVPVFAGLLDVGMRFLFLRFFPTFTG